MNRRGLIRSWLWRLPLVLLGFTTLSLAQNASAQWVWDDVQRWAYEVEDQSDEVYQRAFQESNEGNPDQEYALELLWDLSVKADIYASQVNSNPWGNSAFSRVAYANLYQAFYRADQAMDYASFSFSVRNAFTQLSWAMDRLRVSYNYSYVNDGWLYPRYRDNWYFELRLRHNRGYYWNIYLGRIDRRRLARSNWENRYRNDNRRRAYERVRRDRVERERLDRSRWDRERNRPGRDRVVAPAPGRGRDRVNPAPAPGRDRDRVNPAPGRGRDRVNPAPAPGRGRDRVNPAPAPGRDRVRPPRDGGGRERVSPPSRGGGDRTAPARGGGDRGGDRGGRRPPR